MPPTIRLSSARLFIIFRPCRYFTTLQLPFLICNLTFFLLLVFSTQLHFSSLALPHASGAQWRTPSPGNLWNSGAVAGYPLSLICFLSYENRVALLRVTPCTTWTCPDTFPRTSLEWPGRPHLNRAVDKLNRQSSGQTLVCTVEASVLRHFVCVWSDGRLGRFN